MTFPEIKRLYPTYPIEYNFLCQLDASKKLGQEKLERAREVEVAQHLPPAKGASPTPINIIHIIGPSCQPDMLIIYQRAVFGEKKVHNVAHFNLSS